MYFGSVRFFRHIIVGTVILVIVAATGSSIAFGIKSSQYKKMYEESLATVEELDIAISKVAPEEVDPEESETIPLEDSKQEEVPDNLADMSESELAYQNLYPDMMCDAIEPFIKPEDKTVYLTFDDGPSAVTTKILDTLAKHDVKATFFVIGTQFSESGYDILNRIVAEGHELAIHGYTHEYDRIYESVDAFLEDFYEVYSLIVEHTGQRPTLFRFPGGSINGHNQTVYREIIAEMVRRGFVYYDWNCSAEDAVGKPTRASVTQNTLNNVRSTYSIVLMHDTVSATGEALDDIITSLKNEGYTFDKLSREVKPVTFSYTY